MTFEQLDADRRFQLRDRLREGRLCDVKSPRRRRDLSLVGHGDEVLQVSGSERHTAPDHMFQF
jgi:hypothetical protein